MNISTESGDRILVVTIDRPRCRNAIDRATAHALHDAFLSFDGASEHDVAILTGAGGHFCAGADLSAIAAGRLNEVRGDGPAPLGPSRLRLSKPVIAAIEGYAVAGGLELALWCDLRVAAADAVFGVFCRRFGVPLIDLGTVRLPRLIGHGRAMDLILTGRAVEAAEALTIGLVNRVVPAGHALQAALDLARELIRLPQSCLRNDRLSAIEQWDLDEEAAWRNELARGLDSLASGEAAAGARRFAAGEGRGGATVDDAQAEDQGERAD